MKRAKRTFSAEFKAKVAIEAEEINKLRKENDELMHQIGKLTVGNNWLKKKVL